MPTASLLLLPLKPFLRLLPSLLGLLPPPAPPVHGEPVLSLSKRDPVHARSPGPPSLRIRRHPLEPRTHPPGRTRQTQLSTRPESAPKIRQSSRPGSPNPQRAQELPGREYPHKPPPQPICHSPVHPEPALGLPKEPALSLPKGNPLLAPRPQTPPKCTPPRLKSFLEKTLNAHEAPKIPPRQPLPSASRPWRSPLSPLAQREPSLGP